MPNVSSTDSSFQNSHYSSEDSSGIKSSEISWIKAMTLSPEKAIKAALFILLYNFSFRQNTSFKVKAERIKSDCLSLLFLKTLTDKNQFKIIHMIHIKPQKKWNDGTYCSIRADFATNYLQNKESVEKCSERYKKGATSEVKELQQKYNKVDYSYKNNDIKKDREYMAGMLTYDKVSGLTEKDEEHIKGKGKDGKYLSIEQKEEKPELNEYSEKIFSRLQNLALEITHLYPKKFKISAYNQDSNFFFNPIRSKGKTKAPSDEIMIEELSKAAIGFYGVDFESDYIKHAITVIIEEDQSSHNSGKLYYIQDPKIGLIKCETQQCFQETMKIILNNYPLPKKSRYGNHHYISSFKIEYFEPKEGCSDSSIFKKTKEP